MADNFETNAGSGGSTFAADDISGVLYPRTKIVIGADGMNDGDVSSANPLPVGGTITANLSAIDNAVLDTIAALLTTIDADTSNITACNTGAVTVAASALPTGAATAANQSTEITHLATLAGAVAGNEVQVDVLTMPTVTVTGTVAATQSGTWTVTGAGGTFPVTGTFWQATQPVSIAGTVTVDLGANNDVTVTSGAVTATLAAETTKVIGTVNVAAAQTIAVTNAGTFATQAVCTNAGTFAVQAAQSGTWNIGTVTAVTGITNALPAGTNAIGKLAANSGVDIGDVDVTSIAAGTNTIGGVISQPSTTAAYDGTTSCTIKRLSGIATASGANTIIAAVADKKIRVLALSLLATSTTAVVLYLYNGDYMLLGDGTNKITLDMDGVGGPAGLVMPFNQGGWFQTDTANEALAINLGGATPVIWAITYMEVA